MTATGGIVPAFPPSLLELHAGFVVGIESEHVPPVPEWTRWRPQPVDPRFALEAVVLDALLSGSCHVQFSGGRDSSLVLATAVHVARREGLPLPTAVTLRYPDLPDTAEDAWQDQVVSHLGVPLQVVVVPNGGNELVSPLAVSRTARDGAVIPAPAGVGLARLASAVGPTTLLTGEGGDLVLGQSRISWWTGHWRRRRRPSRAHAVQMTKDVMPRPLRRAATRRQTARHPLAPWLRPAARQAMTEGLADDIVAEPWDWRDARWSFLSKRLCAVGYSTMDAIAEREGLRLSHPLLAPTFVEALCRAAGGSGYATRTEAMHVLAGDRLPYTVLARASKAVFNDAYTGRGVRRFAEIWDGGGVDPTLVDPERLREEWRSPVVSAAAYTPLQLAVVHMVQQGRDVAAEVQA